MTNRSWSRGVEVAIRLGESPLLPLSPPIRHVIPSRGEESPIPNLKFYILYPLTTMQVAGTSILLLITDSHKNLKERRTKNEELFTLTYSLWLQIPGGPEARFSVSGLSNSGTALRIMTDPNTEIRIAIMVFCFRFRIQYHQKQ